MARKKGGGGKLNRSEIIQARLDPQTHLAAEIMARSERRTLSSFIERTIELEAKTYKVRRNLFFPWWSEDPDTYLSRQDKLYSKSDISTVEKAVQDIGADHEAIRFIKFAAYFPELLTKDEYEIFFKIVLTKYFWMHYLVNIEDLDGNILRKEWIQVDAIEGIVQPNLFEYWDKIKSHQIDQQDLDELPIGKKISVPLKNDPNAIKKYIKTGDPRMVFKKVYVCDQEEVVEISKEDTLWKKHAKNLLTEKIEIRQTENGPQIITTLVPPTDKDEQRVWLQFYKNKMEEMTNGD